MFYVSTAEEQSPCDSDVWPGTDGDSGNSTVHSPAEAPKSPYVIRQGKNFISFKLNSLCNRTLTDEWTPTSTSSDQLSAKIDMLEATHRGLHRFVPRHSDEIEIDIGDPVYVQNEADDSWCEGKQMLSGRITSAAELTLRNVI